MTELKKRINNAEKFKQLCVERDITAIELNKRISRYASQQHPFSAQNAVLSRAHMRKELDSGQLSDKLFAIALKIIGLEDHEIRQYLEV